MKALLSRIKTDSRFLNWLRPRKFQITLVLAGDITEYTRWISDFVNVSSSDVDAYQPILSEIDLQPNPRIDYRLIRVGNWENNPVWRSPAFQQLFPDFLDSTWYRFAIPPIVSERASRCKLEVKRSCRNCAYFGGNYYASLRVCNALHDLPNSHQENDCSDWVEFVRSVEP